MRPYKSGVHVVGNRFLMDLRTGQVTHHCRSSMTLLHSQLPPDEPGAQPARTQTQPVDQQAKPAPEPKPSPEIDLRKLFTGDVPQGAPKRFASEVIPEEEEARLGAFVVGVMKALQQPRKSAGCKKAQQDPFWGTGPGAGREAQPQRPAGTARGLTPEQEEANLQRHQANYRRMKALVETAYWQEKLDEMAALERLV